MKTPVASVVPGRDGRHGSRTADIDLQFVFGVHEPHELHVFACEGVPAQSRRGGSVADRRVDRVGDREAETVRRRVDGRRPLKR